MKKYWSIPKPTNTSNGSTARALVEAYTHKHISYVFRNINLEFNLSLGLFSSADIDRGSRLLLRCLSKLLDKLPANALPSRILDAGCGAGVLGISAAKALFAIEKNHPLYVRAQDRDELARLFTLYNAELNMLPPGILEAAAEPLLAGPAPSSEDEFFWDLILSNIPAKAGSGVIEDFAVRSAALLKRSGRVLVVIVHTLAPALRSILERRGCAIEFEYSGSEHSVFCYGQGEAEDCAAAFPLKHKALRLREDFLTAYPFYLRNRINCKMEGLSYTLDAIEGAAAFDNAGSAARAAAKLTVKMADRFFDCLSGEGVFLFHEADQGHFPVWLLEFLSAAGLSRKASRWQLSGRNILSLLASRGNLAAAGAETIGILPAVEPYCEESCRFIALFPGMVPHTRRTGAYWEALAAFLEKQGLLLIAAPSADIERFDREKPRVFMRMGSIRREAFRAAAYMKTD